MISRAALRFQKKFNMIGTRSNYYVMNGETQIHCGWCRPLGIERGGTSCCVVLAHDKGASMEHPLIVHVCNVANLAGLPVLRFDFRGHNMTKAAPSTDGVLERGDTLLCVRDVLRFYSSVILLGHSFGAMILGSLLHEEFLEERLRGFCSISYPLNAVWELSPRHGAAFAESLIHGAKVNSCFAMRRHRRGMLFVHGSQDAVSREDDKSAGFYDAVGIRPVQLNGASHTWDTPSQRASLTGVLGPWLAAAANTLFDPNLSLLGFRP